ncbi:arylamine N-acetyltransferase family protein [Amycolatopsis suaedae]|uniref:Arylamine N-acetyltransferase n=1 Tax=Amycolatopsis suaedae TaxID=2510978 RepID=A0A4Q7J6A3_9PSEU|nr:arylamine N-acetyltransferase [Amycolatopsis suaedae]RZQ61833.1 arylamine N-acetyltransferase [Amycolatopsis suaedae]
MDIDSYLARIGLSERPPADLDGLRLLQRAHLATVPFENLDVGLDVPLTLESGALLDKIVHRRRGGICFELNGAFATLLTGLGFTAHLLQAVVHKPDGSTGYPFEHMTIEVDLDEPWLVDVGFGRFSRLPLRIGEPGPQLDDGGEFRITEDAAGDLTVHRDGTPVYRAERRPRTLNDFVPTGYWTVLSPDSHFTQNLTCSLWRDEERLTLSGDRLIRTTGDRREETTLGSDGEILDVYRDGFGIRLDRVPRLAVPA